MKPLGIVFSAFVDRCIANARLQMRDDFVAQQAQIEALSKQQKSLESKAKALAKQQQAIAKQAKAEKERVRRLNNDRFVRWLDNASWTVRVFCNDSKLLLWVVAIHWFILFPVVGGFTFRGALSDRCIKSDPCRSVVAWIIKR